MPAGGLPEELFRFLTRFVSIINVDLLIAGRTGRTLLTWRDDAIYGAGWHVPGGIIRFQETAADRVHATARSELGAAGVRSCSRGHRGGDRSATQRAWALYFAP